MIKNRVKLTIGGAEYAIITEDDVNYVTELGAELNEALSNVMKENPHISTTQAAVLLALDYADEFKKANITADNLRSQIKDYLDDAASAKSKADWARHEAENAKRELEASKLEIDRLNIQIRSLLSQMNLAGNSGETGGKKSK
ncbi:MAG: cell division protein ZapA [Oscillospiraceae bacterium]|nr:cell division protein ZapA [Oscillospiraceae bacterium]